MSLAAGAVRLAVDVITRPMMMVDTLDDKDDPVSSKIVSA